MSREKQNNTPTNTPTNTNLHQPCKSVQAEEMAKELCGMNIACKDCRLDKLCLARNSADILYNAGYRKQSENVIELPCKVGDKVYFNYVELNEICPAKVIGIHNNYYTPSMPWRVTIEYESQLIGRHEVKIAVDVFNLVCHKTKEEAETKMKGGAE